MKDIAYQMLQPAINFGLSEFEFWDMTKAEIERYLEGALWRLQTKAQFDYSLADLIGASVARLLDSGSEYPTLQQVYPYLFEEEKPDEKELEAEQTATTNSINNFLTFALQHNAKLKKESEDKL